MSPRASRRATHVLAAVAVASTVLLIAVAAFALPRLSSPAAPVQGQGKVVSEDCTTTPFRRVRVAVGLKVIVGTGSETAVTLEAQQNLLSLITTEVQGDELVVEATPPGVTSTQPITLTIEMPELDAVTLGAGASGTGRGHGRLACGGRLRRRDDHRDRRGRVPRRHGVRRCRREARRSARQGPRS